MRAAFRTADPGLIGSIVPGLSKVMVVVGVALCFTLLADVGQAQAAKPEALTNPSFEVWSDQADEGGDEARPAGWSFVTRPQGTQALTLSTDSPADGEASALVDVTSGANEFTNVMQAIEATPFLGQRVRLRAAVRTASFADA